MPRNKEHRITKPKNSSAHELKSLLRHLASNDINGEQLLQVWAQELLERIQLWEDITNSDLNTFADIFAKSYYAHYDGVKTYTLNEKDLHHLSQQPLLSFLSTLFIESRKVDPVANIIATKFLSSYINNTTLLESRGDEPDHRYVEEVFRNSFGKRFRARDLRPQASSELSPLVSTNFGALSLLSDGQVRFNEKAISLPAMRFRLLNLLLQIGPNGYSREALISHLYNTHISDNKFELAQESLRKLINKLRRQLVQLGFSDKIIRSSRNENISLDFSQFTEEAPTNYNDDIIDSEQPIG